MLLRILLLLGCLALGVLAAEDFYKVDLQEVCGAIRVLHSLHN
jgi:hypothetical protein